VIALWQASRRNVCGGQWWLPAALADTAGLRQYDTHPSAERRRLLRRI
jgi:hypothetical protein